MGIGEYERRWSSLGSASASTLWLIGGVGTRGGVGGCGVGGLGDGLEGGLGLAIGGNDGTPTEISDRLISLTDDVVLVVDAADPGRLGFTIGKNGSGVGGLGGGVCPLDGSLGGLGFTIGKNGSGVGGLGGGVCPLGGGGMG